MPTQFDHGLFRILLFRNHATELLVETTPEGLRLPSVAIPSHTRVVEALTAAIRSSWSLKTHCMFTPHGVGSADACTNYQVAELTVPHQNVPAGMQWLPIVSLSAGAFENSQDFVAIEVSVATLEKYLTGKLQAAFGKPGWLKMVVEWVEAHALISGLHLTGEFRQLNGSATFSLIRFVTDGPALWFKAVGEPNLQEFPITLKIAAYFPEFVPHILASQPEWNAWLALESEGSLLDTTPNDRAWISAAETLALLQMATFGRRFELLEAGCKDLRPCSLLPLVAPFLDAMAKVMEQQTKSTPAPLSPEEILSLGTDIAEALQHLSECAIPSTLGHLDVNPGNIIASRGRCVFLDWAEAYVGPPFFTFQYLLEHRRRVQNLHSRHEKRLVSSYLAHWTRFASSKEISAAFRFVPLLAAFAYAAGCGSWRNHESIPSESARHFRSLTRRMKREADTLRGRRSKCLS